jgi:hypothetical protein
MGLTASVCALLDGIGHDRLTDAARAAAHRLVADGIAIAIAGTTEPAIGCSPRMSANRARRRSAPRSARDSASAQWRRRGGGGGASARPRSDADGVCDQHRRLARRQPAGERRNHDEIDPLRERLRVRLEAELDDGTSVAARCDGPRGHWSAAPVPDVDHCRKLEDCLATKMPADAAARLLDRASAIETLDQPANAGLFTETRP